MKHLMVFMMLIFRINRQRFFLVFILILVRD
ncbi:hypothetical protein QUC31_020347 [Theobroma cacao]